MGKWFWSFFGVFFNIGPFFGPFLGTLVENSKHKKNVAPGNSLNFPKKIKILILIFGSQKCVFPNVHFRAPIESEGPGMVSS